MCGNGIYLYLHIYTLWRVISIPLYVWETYISVYVYVTKMLDVCILCIKVKKKRDRLFLSQRTSLSIYKADSVLFSSHTLSQSSLSFSITRKFTVSLSLSLCYTHTCTTNAFFSFSGTHSQLMSLCLSLRHTL